MKKYISIILMLLMIPLLNKGCKTEDLSVGWEIKADTLVFYSDEGVASWCADVKAREDSANCTTVVFLDAVTTISEGMFKNHSYVSTLTLGKNLRTIEDNAFRSCTSLTSVNWSERVESIGNFAFENTGLVLLELPNNLKSIGDFAFSKCEKLTSCILPDSVTDMGCNFTDCPALSTVKLPRGLTLLEDYSFSGCTSLQEVFVPASVKIVGYDAFSESGIVRLIFEGELHEIRSLRTSNMPALQAIVFLNYPPRQVEAEDTKFGLMNNTDSDACVYYLSEFSEYFSSSDGKWNGFVIKELHSIDDLP